MCLLVRLTFSLQRCRTIEVGIAEKKANVGKRFKAIERRKKKEYFEV